MNNEILSMNFSNIDVVWSFSQINKILTLFVLFLASSLSVSLSLSLKVSASEEPRRRTLPIPSSWDWTICFWQKGFQVLRKVGDRRQQLQPRQPLEVLQITLLNTQITEPNWPRSDKSITQNWRNMNRSAAATLLVLHKPSIALLLDRANQFWGLWGVGVNTKSKINKVNAKIQVNCWNHEMKSLWDFGDEAEPILSHLLVVVLFIPHIHVPLVLHLQPSFPSDLTAWYSSKLCIINIIALTLFTSFNNFYRKALHSELVLRELQNPPRNEFLWIVSDYRGRS